MLVFLFSYFLVFFYNFPPLISKNNWSVPNHWLFVQKVSWTAYLLQTLFLAERELKKNIFAMRSPVIIYIYTCLYNTIFIWYVIHWFSWNMHRKYKCLSIHLLFWKIYVFIKKESALVHWLHLRLWNHNWQISYMSRLRFAKGGMQSVVKTLLDDKSLTFKKYTVADCCWIWNQ